jgi:hypothetical protein
MQTDGQTRQPLIVVFRYLSNVPLKHLLLKAIRYPKRNRDSVVGVVTRPRVKWSGVRIPEEANVSLSQKSSIGYLGSTQLPIRCVPGLFPGNKVRCLVEHSPSSGAEVKKVWNYTSILPVLFLAVDRDNCHSIYVHRILLSYFTRYTDCNILWFSLRFYSSVLSGQYPHKSLLTQNICQVFI